MTHVPDASRYGGYVDLARAQRRGVDYEIVVERRPASTVAILAPHGGAIENGTSEIARAIAGDEFNLYLLEGLRSSGNYRALHLTSHRFDEPECLALIANCTVVLALHGCGGQDPRVLLGGRDTALRDRLARAMADAGLDAAVDGHRFPAMQPTNICNRGATGRGVQIELTNPLRVFAAAAPVIAATRAALCALPGVDAESATVRAAGETHAVAN